MPSDPRNEKRKAYFRAYAKANREKRKQTSDAWRAANRERYNQLCRESAQRRKEAKIPKRIRLLQERLQALKLLDHQAGKTPQQPSR